MVYEYFCSACDYTFDVVKRASEMEREEMCEKCSGISTRRFVPRAVYFSGTKVETPYYNKGLGCVVSGKADVKRICKERGLAEVGNDYGSSEKMQETFDKARIEKLETAYDAADKGWIGAE